MKPAAQTQVPLLPHVPSLEHKLSHRGPVQEGRGDGAGETRRCNGRDGECEVDANEMSAVITLYMYSLQLAVCVLCIDQLTNAQTICTAQNKEDKNHKVGFSVGWQFVTVTIFPSISRSEDIWSGLQDPMQLWAKVHRGNEEGAGDALERTSGSHKKWGDREISKSMPDPGTTRPSGGD